MPRVMSVLCHVSSK